MLYVPVVSKTGKCLTRMPWSEEEDRILFAYYGRKPYRDLYSMLPGRSRNSIKGRARKLGLFGDKAIVMSLAKKRYGVCHDYFASANIENSYWAGFIAADGCISPKKNTVKIQLQAGDANHLWLFANCVGYDGPVRLCRGGAYKPESEQALLSICGVSKWVDDLALVFNVTGQKSLTLKPPIGLSPECALAYVIGYIDGDGSIGTTKSKYKQIVYLSRYISIRGTAEILWWIKELFDKLSPPNRAQKNIYCYGGYYQYRVVGKRAESLLRIMKRLQTPKLARKWP